MHVCILFSVDLIKKNNLKYVLHIDTPTILAWNPLEYEYSTNVKKLLHFTVNILISILIAQPVIFSILPLCINLQQSKLLSIREPDNLIT